MSLAINRRTALAGGAAAAISTVSSLPVLASTPQGLTTADDLRDRAAASCHYLTSARENWRASTGTDWNGVVGTISESEVTLNRGFVSNRWASQRKVPR